MELKKNIKSVLLVAAVILVLTNRWHQLLPLDFEQENSRYTSTNSNNADAITQLYEHRISGKMIQVEATVIKILADDLKPPRHQKFIVKVTPEMTVLVTHNTDLAPRIQDINVNDIVEITGQYEWNQRGGVLHWTHLDPNGRHAPGKIVHNGTVYQ